MSRVPNWPMVLARKVEEWRFRPFVYGESDCLQFAGDVVLALTGVDHRPAFPRYRSREEAEAIMQAHGGVLGILSACLGEPKHVSRAMRGDVVLADFGDGMAAGICLGVHCCAPGQKGFEFRPTAAGRIAWTV